MARIDADNAETRRYDLAVVGAGAAGLALANSAHAAGLSVLLLERGGIEAALDPDEPEVAPDTPHDPVARTIRQGLGGTLDIWGGRCVPFDRTDFGRQPGRAGVGGGSESGGSTGNGGALGWPIPYEDYAAWVEPAARFLGVEPVFERPAPAGWDALEPAGIRVDTVERLGPGPLLAALRRQALTDPDGPDVLLESPVLGLLWSEGGSTNAAAVAGVEIGTPGGPDSRRLRISAEAVALACGGLQTTRLLLLEDRRHPGRLRGADALGRGYMGHLTGSIAEITFTRGADPAEFGYRRDGLRSPARRRILLTPPDGPHVALWAESLPGADPRHRSGELSLKALLANGPGGAGKGMMGRHVLNLLRDPRGAAAGATSAVRTRLQPGERHPDRLVVRGPGPYRLAYHAEHLPEPESRVSLSEVTDAHGQPLLRIDFRYGPPTLRGTVAAHRRLARALEAAGLARLDMEGSDDALAARVEALARDGYHQIGLARMADDPRHGVVDRDARAHGTANLYVASAATFPVSSQANPTLSVVAMALRLAAHLAGRRTVSAGCGATMDPPEAVL
jgi:choline dehydrogenase-like flavoprotein